MIDDNIGDDLVVARHSPPDAADEFDAIFIPFFVFGIWICFISLLLFFDHTHIYFKLSILVFISGILLVYCLRHNFIQLSIFILFFDIVCSIYLCALIYLKDGLLNGATGKDLITTKLTDALYFSIVTWTTLGYGDLHPKITSRFTVSIEALLGPISTGFFIVLLLKSLRNNDIDN